MTNTFGRRSRRLGAAWDRVSRYRWSCLTVLLVVLAAGFLPFAGLVERLELGTQDARFAWRGPRETSARVVLLVLDDATVDAWADQPMAFWGAQYAALVRKARKSGAAWIGFDIIPATRAEDALQKMAAQAFERARRRGGLINPHLADDDLDNLLASPELTPDSQFREAVQEAGGRVLLADSVSQGGLLTEDLRELPVGAHVGFVDTPAQQDDAVRTAALFFRDGAKIRPSFPALIAARARRLNPTKENDLHRLIGSAQTGGRGPAPAPAPDESLPTFWINYTGRRFRSIPAHRFLAGPIGPAERRALQGALVLVGPAYRDSGDIHRTPFGAEEYGVAIHADALATLMDGVALRRPTRAQESLLTAAVVALIALLIVLLPFWGGLGVSVAGGALWWWAACQLFTTREYLLPTAGPLVGIGLAFFVYHAVRSLEGGLAHRQIERIFGRYVSPKIRDFLLESSPHQQLGGLEGEASVLFFDTRDSVGRAEKRSPTEVLQDLNDLFRVVVPVIDRHQGLLYGYRGDGFLAVFGAPFPLDNHAQAATEAAIEIVQSVHGLNRARSQSSSAPIWRVGCGVHSGPLVYGNLGVADRSEFTVVGDTVNLAARLEGLNKEPKSEVVVSQATYNGLNARPPARGPQERTVTGRQVPVCVYVLPVPAERRTKKEEQEEEEEM